MKQSNTYHNPKVSFGGILQQMLLSFEGEKPIRGKLIGKEIVLPDRKDLQAIIALDIKENIHLLITPVSDKDRKQLQFELKGLKITDIEWAVGELPVRRYLDISCLTSELPSFKRPFLRYAEDVLYELSVSGLDPFEAVYRTSMRWKRFWSPEDSTEVTKEWLHGLFGELLFLTDIIERFGPDVIKSWTGPLGRDHDFQTAKELAVEIKTSVEIPFSIKCNLHQLDNDLFKKLYIICYKLTQSEKGTTLSDLIKNIENHLTKDEEARDLFYERLSLTGYQLHMDTVYNKVSLLYSSATVYKVDDNFPKIVEKSFVSAPDHRISGIKYTVLMSGLDEKSINNIANDLKKLSI